MTSRIWVAKVSSLGGLVHVRDINAHQSTAVLLLHGQVLDGRLFDPLVPSLPNCRLLIPDLPGHGKSTAELVPALDDIGPRIEAELLARRIKELFVVGYSLGSWHALGIALRKNVKVRGLHMWGPFPGADAAVLTQFSGLADLARAGQLDWVEVFLANCFPKSWAEAHPATVAKTREAILQGSGLTLVEELQRFPAMSDWRPRLTELDVPCVVRVGAEDPSTPLPSAEAIVKAIPGAQLEVVAGVAHHLLAQDFEGTVASVRRMLR